MRCFILFVASAHIALPVSLLRYVSHGAGSAQGAASRRRPLYPRLRPATSPLRGAFDLSLQASGRAEAASLQNTALSPHPCGLPRPSGNVSAMLRPSAPAVSARLVNKLATGRTNCRPGKALAATRQYKGLMTDKLPGGAALARTWGVPTGGPRRLGNAISLYPGSWTRPGYPTGRIRRHARLSPAPRRPA